MKPNGFSDPLFIIFPQGEAFEAVKTDLPYAKPTNGNWYSFFLVFISHPESTSELSYRVIQEQCSFKILPDIRR